MAIDNTTTVPKIVAATFLKEYQRSRVFAARVNNTYRNMLNAYGDTIIINRPGPASVKDYAANDTINYANADVGTPLELSMDKVKTWAVKFDDLLAAISKPNVLQDAVIEHARVLAETVDADVRAKHIAGATAARALTLNTEKNGLGIADLKIETFHRTMDLANMPREGRWAIVGPFYAEIVQKVALANDRILGNADSGGNRSLVNGAMGSFAGFQWYVAPGTFSTQGSPTSGKFSATETVIYGNDTAVAFLDQIRKAERIRLETTFADAVRGLYKYGAQIVYPNRLFKSETTISNVPV